MNRYVVAALLTVALVAMAAPAVDRGASLNTHREVETSIAAIDEAATSLVETEEPSPEGHPDPQRVVRVTLPRDSPTTAAVDRFEIVPQADRNASVVRYVLEDGTTRDAVIDERIVWSDPHGTESIELGGPDEVRLVLTLRTDGNGDPVIVASRL